MNFFHRGVALAITSSSASAGSAASSARLDTRAAAKGGASLVQLRDADASMDELQSAAAAVRDALQGTDCSVVINGVEHLPERKWRAVETRPNGPLGCSAHSVEAVLAAAALGADYVQLGTMFATRTHPGKIPEGFVAAYEHPQNAKLQQPTAE